MRISDRMDSSIITFVLVVFTLAAQVWTLAIKSDEATSAVKQANDEIMKRDLENGAVQQQDIDELRRNYAVLLDSLKNFPQGRGGGHPFSFASNSFGRKRNIEDGRDENTSPDDQNTSVFHGKRNEDFISEWLMNNQQDVSPPQSSSLAFHGKRDVDDIMRYLLNDLDTRNTQKSMDK